MMNFLFGAVAGALIACIGTIAVVRQPDMQVRFGLRPAVAVAAPVPTLPTPACPPVQTDRRVGSTEMLLSPRRFWSIAP